MVKEFYKALLLTLVLPASLVAHTQENQHHNHQHEKQRVEGVDRRGDHAMGFSHEKTTHRFRLSPEGGAIEVTAKDHNDAASLEQIRSHLSHIAKLFKDGDFSKPMAIHGEIPAGVSTMKRLRTDISYTYEAIERGARVRIASANAEAVEAVHSFLRYQIKDHRTGDSVEVDK